MSAMGEAERCIFGINQGEGFIPKMEEMVQKASVKTRAVMGTAKTLSEPFETCTLQAIKAKSKAIAKLSTRSLQAIQAILSRKSTTPPSTPISTVCGNLPRTGKPIPLRANRQTEWQITVNLGRILEAQ